MTDITEFDLLADAFEEAHFLASVSKKRCCIVWAGTRYGVMEAGLAKKHGFKPLETVRPKGLGNRWFKQAKTRHISGRIQKCVFRVGVV